MPFDRKDAKAQGKKPIPLSMHPRALAAMPLAFDSRPMYWTENC